MSDIIKTIITVVCCIICWLIAYESGYRHASKKRTMPVLADIVICKPGMTLDYILGDVFDRGFSTITVKRAEDSGDVWVEKYMCTCRSDCGVVTFADGEHPDMNEKFQAYRTEGITDKIANIILHKTIE